MAPACSVHHLVLVQTQGHWGLTRGGEQHTINTQTQGAYLGEEQHTINTQTQNTEKTHNFTHAQNTEKTQNFTQAQNIERNSKFNTGTKH